MISERALCSQSYSLWTYRSFIFVTLLVKCQPFWNHDFRKCPLSPAILVLKIAKLYCFCHTSPDISTFLKSWFQKMSLVPSHTRFEHSEVSFLSRLVTYQPFWHHDFRKCPWSPAILVLILAKFHLCHMSTEISIFFRNCDAGIEVLVDLKESTGAWRFHTRGLPLPMPEVMSSQINEIKTNQIQI